MTTPEQPAPAAGLRGVDRASLALLALGAIAVGLQVVIPLDEFIHRGDDAYYYFQVAVNFARHGFWSFDSVTPTNGVQPLWAWLLTLTASAAHAVGTTDKVLIARIFTVLTAAAHVGTAGMLFVLLARTVSVGTGLAAAGALLFSMGTVWAHTWGMENSLYGLLLVSAIAYGHLRLGPEPTMRRALLYGLLLALTALARLNAVLLTGFAAAAFLITHYGALRQRAFVLACAIGLSSAAVVTPYVAWNYATTGHPLPISGAVKSVLTADYLRERKIDSQLSVRFARTVLRENRQALADFMSGAVGDGLWPVGSRLVFRERRAIGAVALFALAGCTALLIVRRSERTRFMARIAALGPFAYVAVFAVVNAALSIALYPTQVRYAMTRWWLVESELVLTVVAATVAAATLHALGRLTPLGAHPWWLWRGALAVTALLSLVHTAGFYWNGRFEVRDWNPSWNEHSYRAAQWLSKCAPVEARVGSWNAGVLGYHAAQRVTNLDGLINGFGLLPHLRSGTVAQYIANENLHYLSDAEDMFRRTRVLDQLAAHEVYREYMPLMRQHYRIYAVTAAGGTPRHNPPAGAGDGCGAPPSS